MKSICLINVFFGEFPWYFDFFLKSCGTNPTVNFIIFTDNEERVKLPENVTFIPFSLKQFNQLASEKLDLEINIKYPYKLCDFKPAYGIIFYDYIQNFDYWGMTDIDIVFGRIREFITEEMLLDYEVISVRNDYPTGSFMIFKNSENTNSLFKKSKDYQKVFTSERHFCFDECNSVHKFLENGGDIFEIETEIESMHHILVREMQENNLRVHFDFLIIEGLPGKLFWNNGFLSFKNEFEVLHYHLILYKDNQYSLKRNWKKIPNQFYIDKYLFRKSIYFSKLDFFLNEKIRVWLLQKVFELDYFLSVRMLRRPLKNVPKSNYIIEPYQRFIDLDQNNINKFHFSIEEDFLIPYKSCFNKNVFFLKQIKDIYYHLSSDQKKLTEITGDGCSLIFKKE